MYPVVGYSQLLGRRIFQAISFRRNRYQYLSPDRPHKSLQRGMIRDRSALEDSKQLSYPFGSALAVAGAFICY